MRRQYAEYRQRSWRHAVREHAQPFRSAHLNLTGWVAVALMSLAGGAAGYGGSRLADLPRAAGAAAGASAVVAGLFIVDRRRSARAD